MKTYRHLGKALLLCMARRNLTGMEAAARSGVSQSCMARLISGQRRADPVSLDRLSHAPAWGTHTNAGHQIMIGHLMDELERAGWQSSSILMRARGSRQYALRALHEIEQHISAGDDALAELVERLADILRRASLLADTTDGAQDDDQLQAVAEPTQLYAPVPHSTPKNRGGDNQVENSRKNEKQNCECSQNCDARRRRTR